IPGLQGVLACLEHWRADGPGRNERAVHDDEQRTSALLSERRRQQRDEQSRRLHHRDPRRSIGAALAATRLPAKRGPRQARYGSGTPDAADRIASSNVSSPDVVVVT